MTSRMHSNAQLEAIRSLVEDRLPGALVVCGGAGRSAFQMMQALTDLEVRDREIFVFTPASELGAPLACEAEVFAAAKREAFETTGYDMRLVRFINGDIRCTLRSTQTLRIALLQLESGDYESISEALRTLYPRLCAGGLLIMDNLRRGTAGRQAFEDYFAQTELPFKRPMLWPVDETACGAVKLENIEAVEIERYDYIPPGMSPPNLLPLFPHAVPDNPWTVNWPYLRKGVPHLWRTDRRHEGFVTGYASAEEAACLFHFGSQFAGKRGVEIGSHYGWTAAHLLAAGLRLDCIDPAFCSAERHAAVYETLSQIPEAEFRLWGGTSPEIVPAARASQKEPWSFAFIDGDHDADAPCNDATAVLPWLAPDAMVVFHDLMSPHVEAGLAVFREAGFSTQLINTMQILGVAWRGDVVAPAHTPDPNAQHIFNAHLAKYL